MVEGTSRTATEAKMITEWAWGGLRPLESDRNAEWDSVAHSASIMAWVREFSLPRPWDGRLAFDDPSDGPQACGHPDVDQLVDALWLQYRVGDPLNLDTLDSVADKFFNSQPDSYKVHDRFFYCFHWMWRSASRSERSSVCWEILVRLLRAALSWEERTGRLVHKGAPLFFLAVTAMDAGDIDRGYVLMHQALQEDIRSHGSTMPDSPTLKFITLSPHGSFQDLWVLAQRERLEVLLRSYFSSYGRRVEFSEIQTEIFACSSYLETTFAFGHALARLVHLERVPSFLRKGHFVSQLKLNLLFDLSLVIDSFMKSLYPIENSYGRLVHAFLAGAGFPVSARGAELPAAADWFNRPLDEALADRLSLAGNRPVDGLERDVWVTYGFRNKGAHSVASSTILGERFDEVVQSFFSTLFLVFEHVLSAHRPAGAETTTRSPPNTR